MNRKETLNEAERIVCGERQGQYGSPEDSFGTIAKFWSDYLKIDIEPKQVADLMILLKMARISEGKYKADNYIDICGYAACANEIESSEGITGREKETTCTPKSVKPKFKLEDYEGDYAMHCPTEEGAEIFCKFLDDSGKEWRTGKKYKDWTNSYDNICYGFNDGTWANVDTYKAMPGSGYEILEFDDYDWSDYDDTKSEKK